MSSKSRLIMWKYVLSPWQPLSLLVCLITPLSSTLPEPLLLSPPPPPSTFLLNLRSQKLPFFTFFVFLSAILEFSPTGVFFIYGRVQNEAARSGTIPLLALLPRLFCLSSLVWSSSLLPLPFSSLSLGLLPHYRYYHSSHSCRMQGEKPFDIKIIELFVGLFLCACGKCNSRDGESDGDRERREWGRRNRSEKEKRRRAHQQKMGFTVSIGTLQLH